MSKGAAGERPAKALGQGSMRRLLELQGWVAEVGGKHVVKMTKGGERPITLPHHDGNDYGKGLRGRILKQAGLAPSSGKDSDDGSRG